MKIIQLLPAPKDLFVLTHFHHLKTHTDTYTADRVQAIALYDDGSTACCILTNIKLKPIITTDERDSSSCLSRFVYTLYPSMSDSIPGRSYGVRFENHGYPLHPSIIDIIQRIHDSEDNTIVHERITINKPDPCRDSSTVCLYNTMG